MHFAVLFRVADSLYPASAFPPSLSRSVCLSLPRSHPRPARLSDRLGQEIRNPYLVKMHSAHPHRLATYDARGVQTTGGMVVLTQAEFCSGGTLQDHLNLLIAASSRGCKRAASSSSDRRYDGCDREVIGPQSRKVYTPEAELMAKAEEEKRKRRSAKTPAGAAAPAAPALAAAAAWSSKPDGEVTLAETRKQVATLPDRNLARRLEIWMRQVSSVVGRGPRARSEADVGISSL